MNPEPEVKPVETIAQEPQTVNTEAETPESKKDIDWKRFKAERQKEREEAERVAKRAAEKEAEAEALKQALEAVLNKQQQSVSQVHQFYQDEETEEQRIKKQVEAAIEARERQRQQEQAEYESRSWPERLRQQYNDFDQVCGAENIDYLMYHYPEIAKGFKHMPEGVEKWDSVYKTIKKLIPNTNPQANQKRVENNLVKPQSLSAVHSTPSNATPAPIYLDEARRAANWERMQKTLKGLG